METCEIYITGMSYKNRTWLDDPDELLDQLYSNFNEIQNFSFSSLSLRMAQVYNVSLKVSNYDSMVLYLKKVKYKQQDFLELSDVEKMVEQLKLQMSYIEYLGFSSVEVRTSKLFTDIELGLVQRKQI